MKDRAAKEGPSQGRFIGAVHVLPVRVYYEDTDFSGVVYHASYLKFLERGRSEALRSAGIDHKSLVTRAEPLVFAVRCMNIAFLKPAQIDDALAVRTSYDEVKGARILARQDIFRGEEGLVRAEVEIACLSLGGRPRRLPAELAQALEARRAAG